MRESAGLDDLDLRLVTVLQTVPRADWEQVGHMLGVSASTAARRWRHLTDARIAWQTCYPQRLSPGTSLVVAFIEVDCFAPKLQQVIATLAEDPHVFNLGHFTGPSDLLVTAAFNDHLSLARYVGSRLSHIDGLIATRTHIATAVHAEGGAWRLDRVPRPPQPTHTHRNRVPGASTAYRPDAIDMHLIDVLSQDVRQTAGQLAELIGLSPTSVRRRLARLESHQRLAYRCDVARFASGWPASVNLWAVIPPDRVSPIIASLLALRETRLCVSLSSHCNLLVNIWLRTLEGLPAFEAHLRQRIPDLTIADRSVLLWRVKFAGQLLDGEGRHIRSVPIAPWPAGT